MVNLILDSFNIQNIGISPTLATPPVHRRPNINRCRFRLRCPNLTRLSALYSRDQALRVCKNSHVRKPPGLDDGEACGPHALPRIHRPRFATWPIRGCVRKLSHMATRLHWSRISNRCPSGAQFGIPKRCLPNMLHQPLMSNTCFLGAQRVALNRGNPTHYNLTHEYLVRRSWDQKQTQFYVF